MTVSTIATIAIGLSRTFSQQNSSRSSAVLGSLLGAGTKPATDVMQLSAAAALQNQISQFRVASQNIAQSSGLLAAADNGASEIARQLARLRDIAARAADAGLSADARAELNIEFQSVRQRIDRIARGTRFNNESLLDGSSTQLKVPSESASGQDLSVGSLTDATLFKGTNPDISTASGAKVAEATVKAAQEYVQAQRDVIGALQDAVEFAAVTVETAIQNQDSSRSTIVEGDLLSQLLGINPDESAPSIASLAAQSHKLPGSILQLLGE